MRSLVTSVSGLLEERAASAPPTNWLLSRDCGPATPKPRRTRCSPAAAGLPTSGPGQADSGDDTERGNVNSALRSLHEPDIIDDKLAAGSVILQTVPAEGGKVVLTPEQADAWLAGLNDVRLALGTNLGIDSDTPDEVDPDDPRAPHYDVYHWLTWMQDSLVQALIA
ncbi:DUF2017 family protein [Rhodococcus hoagii]|nr:DUF2017 family protein [Prescottella equi]